MTDWVTGVVEGIGYPGIAVLMALEMVVPLVQSEIVMTFAGFAASTGRLHLVGVILAGIAGSQSGSLALFALCRRLPQDRVRRFFADHGAWVGLTDAKLQSAEERFRNHQGRTVLLGRLLPGLRSFIAVPAGLLGMPIWRFFAFNLIGTVFWVSLLAVAGSLLGRQYALVDRYSSYLTAGLVAAVIGVVGYRFAAVRRHRLRRSRTG